MNSILINLYFFVMVKELNLYENDLLCNSFTYFASLMSMSFIPRTHLLQLSPKGLYCPIGDFYIDPSRAVDRAVITHAHGDHVKAGMKHYLTHQDSSPIIKLRIGTTANIQGLAYGETLNINGVNLSFHPAGHIIGSSQVRLEYKGEIWVVSGDYKIEDDGVCTAFESVKCHTFITESTFGLPIYKWAPQAEVFNEVNAWWQQNRERGLTSIILSYALGKAQRILHHLDPGIGEIFVHGSIKETNDAFRNAGIMVKDFPVVLSGKSKDHYRGAIIVAPPNWANANWLKKFQPYATASASGWMATRGSKQKMPADKGFTLSDHADWEGLNKAVKDSKAERVLVTHGYTKVFSKWLNELGLEAYELHHFGSNIFDSNTQIAEHSNLGGEAE